jgi:hypothetical protein
MFEARVDFGHPLGGNPRSLLEGKRVIRGLQFDIRTHPVVSEMQARLQVLGAWIEREFRGEPPEERADMRPFWCVEESNELIEAVLAQQDPDAPNERLGLAMHRLQAAANEWRPG